jgi:hypothetical protein
MGRASISILKTSFIPPEFAEIIAQRTLGFDHMKWASPVRDGRSGSPGDYSFVPNGTCLVWIVDPAVKTLGYFRRPRNVGAWKIDSTM